MNTPSTAWKLPGKLAALAFATSLALFFLLTTDLLRADPNPTVRFQKRNYFPLHGPTTATFGRDRLYDDFTVNTAEKLTGIGWMAGYFDMNNPANNPIEPTTEQWEITIYADDDGSPGALLFSEIQDVEAVETTHLGNHFWAPDPNPYSYYAFKMDFGDNSFVAEPNRKYWLSIHSLQGPGPGPGVLPGVSDSTNFNHQAGSSYLDPGSSIIENIRGRRERKSDIGMRLYGVPLDDGDADGMLDSWEQAHGLDLQSDDALLDPDNDGLNNLGEFELGSDPRNPDTDRDGLPDGVETDTRVFVDETDTGTSPLSPDTDRDGFRDPEEIACAPFTDPNLADSDVDGYSDFLELKKGTDPNDPQDFTPPRVLESLVGGDATNPENNGDPNTGTGFGATFDSNANPGWDPQQAYRLFDNETADLNSQWYESEADRYLVVTVTFPDPILLSRFALTSGSLTELYDPSEWEILGSVDGETFEPIFWWNDLSESLWTARNQTLLFEAGVHFRQPKAFTTFRFVSIYTLGWQSLQLSELELFATEPQTLEIIDFTKDQPEIGMASIRWKSRPGMQYQVEGSRDGKAWRPIKLVTTEGSEGATVFSLNPHCEPPWLSGIPLPKAMLFRVVEVEAD